MKHIAIVMAAGTGSRMGSDIPKQFLTVKDHQVLYFSLKVFQDSFIDEIILVTRTEDITYCKENIVEKYNLTKVTKIVSGGSERFESVYEGLKAVDTSEDTYVYIHDGARPCITEDVLERAREDVLNYKAIVVGVPSKDTVKIADESGFVKTTPSRSLVWNVQTPQAFEYSLIRTSFDKMMAVANRNITDDGMVVEAYSDTKVHLTMGDYRNIKVTTKEDLLVVEKFL